MNSKKISLVGLALIALWGAALAVSNALGCQPCVDFLTPLGDKLNPPPAVSSTTPGV